ncbi:YTH-domain-containing protein [Hypoxylon sp. FL1150]|nr:YTH-domain-containing protein [Hypoxylon sp. FL1150]
MDRSISNSIRELALYESPRGRGRTQSGGYRYETDHHYHSPDQDESMMRTDLKEWLQATHWYDVAYRNEKLSSYRAAQFERDMMGVRRDDHHQQLTTAPPKGPRYGDRGRSFSRPRFQDATSYRSRDYPMVYQSPLSADRTSRLGDFRPYRHQDDHIFRKSDLVYGKRDPTKEKEFMDIPKPLSLGEKDDVRFFTIKSCSWDYVYDCMEEGIWATQRGNLDALTSAFTQAKKVVLFFSVNRSRGQLGYAVMKSLPSASNPRPRWWSDVKWKISHPFKVEWHCKTFVHDLHVIDIKNPLNLYLGVTRSRDGQEIDHMAGRQMLAIIERQTIKTVEAAKRRQASEASQA